MSSALPKPTPEFHSPRVFCPSCRRPIATERAKQCIYCGSPLQSKVRPSVEAKDRANVAAEFATLGKMAQPQQGGNMGQWVIRIGALALGSLLVFGLLGPCMR